jgi:hypothetical protein
VRRLAVDEPNRVKAEMQTQTTRARIKSVVDRGGAAPGCPRAG